MPIVQIKGSNQKVKFPDQMSQEQILNALKRQYPVPVSQKVNAVLEDKGPQVSNRDLSISEKISRGVGDFLYDNDIITSNQDAYRIGSNLGMGVEALPIVGDAVDADDFKRAYDKGDGVGMGLASLGVIPIAGDVLKQTLRKARSINLPKGKIGADQFKLLKQSDPKATTKVNPDGSITASYLEEYQPKQIKGPLYEFEPDALELSEDTFKNTKTFKGNKDKPISVTKEAGDYKILDGHHRAKLAKEEGRNVKAVVIPIDDVVRMKKDNIHQADMFSEWVARGLHKPQSVDDLPMKGRAITSWSDLFEYTPEQLIKQAKFSDPDNVIDGVYTIDKGKWKTEYYEDGTSALIEKSDGKVLREFDAEGTSNNIKEKIIKADAKKPEAMEQANKRKAAMEQARQIETEKTYKMQHTAPMRGDNPTGENVSDSFGDDIYTGNALKYFGTGASYDRKAINVIQSIKNKPNAEITIYRAVPKNIKEINEGDWITTTKEYASDHMASEKNWHILSKKVKAKDIATDGNSIHEFGYSPEVKK